MFSGSALQTVNFYIKLAEENDTSAEIEALFRARALRRVL